MKERKGIVQISPELIIYGMKFPEHWILESIHMNKGDGYAVAVISGVGEEFPEVPERSKPKLCKIIVHKENSYYEVKVIK